MSCTITPFIPNPKNALIPKGTPKGTSTTLGVMKPISTANSAIAVETTEPSVKGMANVGFNISGNPKTTGSLIPKIPGIKAVLDIALWSSLFEAIKLAMTRQSVNPAPPGTTNVNQKPKVIGSVGCSPFSTAAIFAAKAAKPHGHHLQIHRSTLLKIAIL